MVDPFIFMEAINSVSLSHEEECDCLTCRAADGDEQAFAQVWADVAADQLLERPTVEDERG